MHKTVCYYLKLCARQSLYPVNNITYENSALSSIDLLDTN